MAIAHSDAALSLERFREVEDRVEGRGANERGEGRGDRKIGNRE